MAKLAGKLGEWELPHVHAWKERSKHINYLTKPLISPRTRVATIGSCFAAEIALAMEKWQLNGSMHPGGLFYTTRSIRQEMERIFGGWPEYNNEPIWKTAGGYVHPFKNYGTSFPDVHQLEVWSDMLDAKASQLFMGSDVIVITLGLIEAWMNPTTGNFYRQIPHPDVLKAINAQFYRLSVGEMIEDLERIRATIRGHTNADLILTVSPVPLQATLTPLDVRVANTESKSRIRAAVSEFIDRFPDVHYFHSYEIVTAAERISDFMLEDARHVRPEAVDYIVQQFLAKFGDEGVEVPIVDTSWITSISKRAQRPAARRFMLRRGVGFLVNQLTTFKKGV